MLAPIYETVRLVKAELRPRDALLGFCGAPWTVATYMVAGHGTPDQAPARLFAYRQPQAFQHLIDCLVEASADYLVRQFEAGVDAVQIFDTWAGVLPPEEFARWCMRRRGASSRSCARKAPGAKVIGFPRGAGTNFRAMSRRPASMRSVSKEIDRELRARANPARMPVQGNLDPLALLAGGAALDRAVDASCRRFGDGPFIFNLGHGILPETPIEHVERMLQRVRAVIALLVARGERSFDGCSLRSRICDLILRSDPRTASRRM